MAWCRTCRIFKLVETDLPLHICIFGLSELADLNSMFERADVFFACIVHVWRLLKWESGNKHASKGGVSETGPTGM